LASGQCSDEACDISKQSVVQEGCANVVSGVLGEAKEKQAVISRA
jgi:hypothetical protein